jgi:hypothetical protein
MRIEPQQIVTNGCQAMLSVAFSLGLVLGTASVHPALAEDAELKPIGHAQTSQEAELTRNIPDIDAAVSPAKKADEAESQPARSVATVVPGLSAERDKLISPPGEEVYYPVRTDGQPFVLNIDQTVNLTRAINQFIWNPRIEGEVWTPFDQPELIERASRLMTTWPEYDEANIYRSFTRVNKYLERISGFGP